MMRRSSSSPSVVRVNGPSSSSLPDEVLHLPYFYGDVASMQDVRSQHSSQQRWIYIAPLYSLLLTVFGFGSHAVTNESRVWTLEGGELFDLTVFSIVKKYINYDGHFLLRESFTKPGTLTVSVLYGRGVKHFNVAKHNGNYFLKDRLFHSINDLILHYRTHDVPNVEGISNVRLVTPIVTQSFKTTPVNSSGSGKMPGSHFQLQEQSNSRLSSHSTERNINILSTSQPRQMHYSKTSSLNKFSQPSSCHSVLGNFQQSDELASGFATASSSNSSDYLFGRLPPKKSSVRCHQRMPRRQPRSLPTDMAPNLYYSTVRDTYKELAPNLIKMLCEVENSEDERCICGLLYEEAELIMGWTMHLSTEPESDGKLFFMGPDGETAWQLPPEIILNLSVDHQHRIQELSRDHS